MCRHVWQGKMLVWAFVSFISVTEVSFLHVYVIYTVAYKSEIDPYWTSRKNSL